MNRFSEIWRHPLYQEQFRLLQEAEKERIFCNHTLSHFLDTARLMYLYTLTEQTGLPQDLIYAAALLHDIGRFRQLQDGTPHEEAGAALAAQILPDCGYTPEETADICQAILGHRSESQPPQRRENPSAAAPGSPDSTENTVGSARGRLLALCLRRADKKSRCCFCCPAARECNWPEDKRNSFPEF